MITRINSLSTQPSFGMSLHMPANKQIVTVLGNKAAEGARKATPILEDCARDVNIRVSMEKPVKTNLKALNIGVGKLGDLLTEYSSVLVCDETPAFSADMLADYLVKTAQLLKSRLTLPPKVNSFAEMINPSFDAGCNINPQFYCYIVQHPQGYVDDLKKDLGVDDDFVKNKFILGDIKEPLPVPKEIIESNPNYDNRQMYYITSASLSAIRIYGIIKPEYKAQFEDDVKHGRLGLL